MLATTPRVFGAAVIPACLALLAGATALGAAQAPDPASPDAQPPEPRKIALVRVRLPITGNDDTIHQARIARAADQLVAEAEAAGDQRRPLLVLEFDPGPDGGATEFERALRLARFLVGDQITRVKTLAYLPESVEGHATLVALACEEIAMAPDALLGSAGAFDDDSRPVEAGIRASYLQIAEARRTAPAAVALAMIDPAAELVRVETDRGVEYALGNDLESLREDRSIVSEDTLSPAGALAAFTGREARQEGFAKYLAADRDALARALAAPGAALLEDQSLAGEWRPVLVDLEGPITHRSVRRIETLIGDELERNGVNWIGLRIDSSGGEIQPALRLAQTLAELGDGEVRTVAYVPKLAEGPAALVALACDQLVIQEGATLSGAAPDPEQAAAKPAAEPENPKAADAENEQPAPEPQDDPARHVGGLKLAPAEAQTDAVRATIRDVLAPATPRTWSLLASAVDPSLDLAEYSNRKTGATRLFSEEELEDLPDAGDWRRGDRVKPAGEALRLPAVRAVEVGVAVQTVQQFDDLQAVYGFSEPPRTAKPNWALELVEALASPGLAALLLVVGIVGLYIELNSPGLGIGGFIAAVALLLFFWSKFLDGTADWLEVMLFVAGLVFVMIELLVLPGFGIFGLGGALMIVASLVLASQTFVLPKTESQLVELRNSLATVTGAGLAVLVLGAALRHYLPHSPLFAWASLQPLEEADRIEQQRRESFADYAHLIGKPGVATTDLLPAGRAEVDGEPLDVISQGEVIERGNSIEVVEAHGHRVLVRRTQP